MPLITLTLASVRLASVQFCRVIWLNGSKPQLSPSLPAYIVLNAGLQPAYSSCHSLVPVKLPGLKNNTYLCRYVALCRSHPLHHRHDGGREARSASVLRERKHRNQHRRCPSSQKVLHGCRYGKAFLGL